ncbi:zinc finger CCCH domain-containing protein 14 [Impatiens glandulifera]|uniref:zinc finger CCCH domain-containing protein 14 n=1 Tax=Impatiens glandulifera TaxID=253017 RepID=UPI001FB1A1E8|nr:zinc finger CCCH domain-containing protein 14 [Impatiens glandulifera]
MDFGAARKRGRQEAGMNGNGGFKKSKQEMESFSPGIGSKSKPCTKFFSTSGCPFGEGCHFLHYVPGGINAVTQMIGNNPALPAPSRNPPIPSSFQDNPSPNSVKVRLCNKFNTAEGCRFGDKCHFAHGEWELGKPSATSHEDPRHMGGPPMTSRFGGRMESNAPTSFGASATAKISVDASLAGAIIGKGGVNSKQIRQMTGVKLSIRDHESDMNLKNIELEGTFDQIKEASAMVRDHIAHIGAAAVRNSAIGQGQGQGHGHGRGQGQGQSHGQENFKTKICGKFEKGTCTFGDRCHFAHGAEELRRSAI